MKLNNIKLVEPPEVVLATQDYRKHNDVFMHFLKDKIEKIEKDITDEDGKPFVLKSKILWKEFKIWYVENYPSFKMTKFNQLILVKELSKFIGKPDEHDNWIGYKLKEEEGEDVESTFTQISETSMIKKRPDVVSSSKKANPVSGSKAIKSNSKDVKLSKKSKEVISGSKRAKESVPTSKKKRNVSTDPGDD